MKKYVCKICGYVVEAEEKPQECPICFASGDDVFEEVAE